MTHDPNFSPPPVKPAQPQPTAGQRPTLGAWHWQPKPQDYANALARLTANAPGQISTPGALGTNLLADALLRYGQMRAQKKLATNDASAAGGNSGSLSGQNPDGSPISYDPTATGGPPQWGTGR